MFIERIIKESFIVIGKEDSTYAGSDFIKRIWEDASIHFNEISHLVKKDANGELVGIWGAMSDMSRTFKPWEDDFNTGLYLAGIECIDEAEAPEGWTKWIVPGYEYLRIECTKENIFNDTIEYMKQENIPLVGAVHEFTCPKTKKNYMYFPIRKI